MYWDAKEKGKKGEDLVYGIVTRALNEMDFKYQIMRNARFPFESIYGKNGYITAEIDIVVFTPFYIYLFEIKNESYKEFDYKEPIWTLMNGESVSNPLRQNHTHKEVFCSELNISREKIFTIEILLENGKVSNEKSPYPNDFVFTENDLQYKLKYLLSTECEQILETENLCQQFNSMVSRYNISEEEHIEKLRRTEKIETRIRRVIGYVNLHRTDIVYCNCCNIGKLNFREKNYLSTEESIRESKHYFLGCSSYGDNEIVCNAGLIFVDQNKDATDFMNLNPVSIEQNNGWGEEKVTKTILDEIENLNRTNEELHYEIERIKQENLGLKRSLRLCKGENEKQASEISQLLIETSQTKKLKDKLNCFKRIFGKIYMLKE